MSGCYAALAAMEPIPNFCEGVADSVSNKRGDDDDGNGGGNVKRLNDDVYADHVRPHREVDERLPPSERDNDDPDDMYAAQELPDGKPCLRRIQVIHNKMLYG